MRLYLYREHIEKLNLVSDKNALKIMKDIKAHFHLPNTRYISIKAYCDYFMVERDDVYATLNKRNAS